ncbi:MAG: hypothetical protein LBT27_07465 [Prevotellaceae bacterium]|jgi:hypothetical protein|nr:hypothetical protein [Prevotellaceae bacterium]
MKKLIVAVVFVTALFAAQNANGQSLSSDQQAIINRQRTEIQQKRNSANEYQQKANEAKERCEHLRKSKPPAGESGSAGYSGYVESQCDKVADYQKKANEFRKEADEQERLLNAAIEKAKANSKNN